MAVDDEPRPATTATLTLRAPVMEDGAALWKMTKETEVLDLNSSYYYLLWCRDFSATSVIAEIDGKPAGFVTGYMRPDAPDTLLIWQVAVTAAAQGQGLASKMLNYLAGTTGASALETTITEDNPASIALFTKFAKSQSAEHAVTPLFTHDMYPDNHDTEYLHHISPLNTSHAIERK